MSAAPPSIPVAPSPWSLKASSIYLLPFFPSSSRLPSFGTVPSTQAEPGKFVGRLGMIQILRYTESPVGPYDELLVVPGYFDVERDGKTEKRVSITRIWVSSPASVWNGRHNWNIPKQLANFSFSPVPSSPSSTRILVTLPCSSPSSPSTVLFHATFRPTPYLPSFPFSTSWLPLNLTLAQPPLKSLKDHADPEGLLVGTEGWCGILPLEKGRTSIGWWDLRQEKVDESTGLLDSTGTTAHGGIGKNAGNLYPEFGRWRVGVVMQDADVEFPDPSRW